MPSTTQPESTPDITSDLDYEITNNPGWFVPDRRFCDRKFVEGLIMAVLVEQEHTRRSMDNIHHRGLGKDLTPYDYSVLLNDAKAIVDAFIDAGVSCRRGIPSSRSRSVNGSRTRNSTTQSTTHATHNTTSKTTRKAEHI